MRTEATVMQLEVPPHNSDFEQAVLGSVLITGSAWDEIADLVSEADFYRGVHREIFAAMAALADKGQPLDVLTVNEALEDDQLAYLGSLAKETPSAANVKTYATAVHDYSVRRRLVAAGEKVRALAMLPDGISLGQALDQAEQTVLEVEKGRKGEALPTVKETLLEVVDNIDRMYQAGSSIIGLPTGFVDIDRQTTGLQPGNLIIIGGRPSMGKTALAMNIAEYVSVQKQRPVGVFSLEMSRQELAMRMLASIGRIDFGRLRTGNLHDEEWPKLTHATGALSQANDYLHIDDTGGLTLLEVRTRARRMKREHDIRLLVVDYLQLMRGDGENRNLEVSDISRGLKALAKELDIPVIALSQLNRGPEGRENKRPSLADLRDSGGIEQDADVVAFVYRDEVYNEDSNDAGTAEIILAKQRNGPTGTVRLTFNGKIVRFDSYVP